jgi:hypothetical protein
MIEPNVWRFWRQFNVRFVLLVIVVSSGLICFGLAHVHLHYFEDLLVEELWEVGKAVLAIVICLISMVGLYSLMGSASQWDQMYGASVIKQSVVPAPRHILIYFDGIHQVDQSHPPRIAAFLAMLESRLPPESLLIKSLSSYANDNTSLEIDPAAGRVLSSLKQWDAGGGGAFKSLLKEIIVQVNNVIKVGILSDSRYGPIVKYQQAFKVYQLLAERVDMSTLIGSDITLLGYSGGGQIALGSASFLSKMCNVKVSVCTICGVYSGNQDISDLSNITTIQGSKDPVAGLCRFLFPRRIAYFLSKWTRAEISGRVKQISVKQMEHNGEMGPFSNIFMTRTVDKIINEIFA